MKNSFACITMLLAIMEMKMIFIPKIWMFVLDMDTMKVLGYSLDAPMGASFDDDEVFFTPYCSSGSLWFRLLLMRRHDGYGSYLVPCA